MKTMLIVILAAVLAGCAAGGGAGCVSPVQGSMMAGCSEGANPVPYGD